MDSGIFLNLALRALRDVEIAQANNSKLKPQTTLGRQFDSKYEYEQFAQLTYFGAAQSFNDGSNALEMNMQRGYTQTITPQLVGGISSVTKLGMNTDPFGVFTRRAEKMYESLLQAKAIHIANKIAGGFSAVTSADGVALFSASHTTNQGGSYSNLLAATTLSYTSLESLVNVITDQKDPVGGRFLNTEGFDLVVPRNLEIRAKTIIRSTQVAGTNNNDVNVLASERGISVRVLDYLGDYPSTGSTGFYLIPKNSDMYGFRLVYNMKPTTTATVGVMGQAIMSIQESYASGWMDGYNIAGCAGAS